MKATMQEMTTAATTKATMKESTPHNDNNENQAHGTGEDCILPILVQKGRIPGYATGMVSTSDAVPGAHQIPCQKEGDDLKKVATSGVTLVQTTESKEPQGVTFPSTLQTEDSEADDDIADVVGAAHGTADAPRLARSTNIATRAALSEPGAFAAAPGQGSQRQEAVHFSLFERTQGASDDEASRSNHNSPRLSEAKPVNEEEERAALQDATPVAAEASESKRASDVVSRRFGYFCLAIVLVACATAGIISATLSVDNDKPQPPLLRTSPPTGAPSPNSSVSLAPSPQTPFVLKPELLLNSSMTAIEVPLSPQNKAYVWLVDHPDISNMTESRKVQLFALGTFYFSFHGDNWPEVISSDWLVYEKSECDWYSDIFAYVAYNMAEAKFVMLPRNTNETSCNDAGELTRLSLMLPGTKGTSDVPAPMPPEIGLLTSLKEIKMGYIQANGPLPDFFIPEMKNLVNLRRIHLHKNNFSASIPLSIFDVLPAELGSFVIKGSSLSGTIPSNFQHFPQLTTLEILGALNGSIPTELGMLTLLESLSLANPELDGTIPSELYALTHLSKLHLLPSGLTGTLSPWLGNWTKMRQLNLDAPLMGAVPSTMDKLHLLERVTLQNTMLFGSLPFLGHAEHLLHLGLCCNRFEGSIPGQMFANPQWQRTLNYLDLSHNFLSAIVPDSIWSLTSLNNLALANNDGLVGSIPASKLGSFSSLSYLHLSSNSFYGEIPFASMTNSSSWLNSLHLDDNSFSGSISSEVGLLTRLTDLSLANNGMLSGSIPEEIGNCTWMNKLQLQGNSFVGSIPTNLGLLGWLTELNLSNNSGFAGLVPTEMGLLSRLTSLSLQGTSLTGPIPEQVCALKTNASLEEIQINCTLVSCTCNCSCA